MLAVAAMAVGLVVGAVTMNIYDRPPPPRQTQASGTTQMASTQALPAAPMRTRLPPP